METLNFHEYFDRVTRYFHDAWEDEIRKALDAKKWDVIDLTGSRFTLYILTQIMDYVRREEVDGRHVKVVDDRELMKRAFETLYEDVAIKKELEGAPELKVPTTVDEFKELSKTLEQGGTYEAPHIRSPIPANVTAAWYVYVNLMYPQVRIDYNAALSEELRQLFNSCMKDYAELQTELQTAEGIAIILHNGALTKVYKTSEGKYDCGTYGQLTFQDLRSKFCLIPNGFGEIKSNPRGDTPLCKFCLTVLTIVHQFIKKEEKKRIPMDLYSVLNRGYI